MTFINFRIFNIIFISIAYSLLIIIINFIFVSSVFAQSATSQTVITRVGNPSGTPPPGTRRQPPYNPQTTSEFKDALKKEFDLTFNGYNLPQLQWAWEKMWDVSATRFGELVKGTIYTSTGNQDGGSEQTGCRTISLAPYANKETFLVILVHESGHLIQRCAPSRAVSFYDQHDAVRKPISQGGEGYLTGYSQTACTYTNPTDWNHQSEDYAETIAYYLNPEAGEQSARCARQGPNPYANGNNPKHFEIAKSILGNYP